MRQSNSSTPFAEKPYPDGQTTHIVAAPRGAIASLAAESSMNHSFCSGLWRVAFVAGAAVSTLLGLSVALSLPSPGQPKASVGQTLQPTSFLYPIERPINILLMGIDQVPNTEPGSPESFTGRSDTMLLVHMDPRRSGAAVLSIPRDTQVEIPDYGLTKVNHANWIGGPLMVREVLKHNLNGVGIDRYVRINTGAFRALVDAVGGVRVFIPKRMEYTDHTQKLYIDLQPGWQTLNGEQAEQFARFRNDEWGDIGRVQRQQMLLKALRENLSNPTMVARVPQLLEVFQTYVDTNLAQEEMLALVNYGLQLDPKQLNMVMLPGRASEPGEFSASYWVMDEGKKDKILADYFEQQKPAYGVGSELGSWDDPQGYGDEATDAARSADLPLEQLRIAVQNASGQPDRGAAMAAHLQSLGFSNVYVVDDWPDDIRTTQIIVQQGDLSAARQLRDRLALGDVASVSTGDLESDLTLQVGRDWQPASP